MANQVTKSARERMWFRTTIYLAICFTGSIILGSASYHAVNAPEGVSGPHNWLELSLLTLGSTLIALGVTGAISAVTDKGIDGELFNYLSILEDERLTSRETEDLAYFRRSWNVYHLTYHEQQLKWVYTKLDLTKRHPGQLLGTTHHKPTNAPYQIAGFLRRDKLFLVHTSTSDRLMSPSISSFPNCRNFGELHAGWLQHVCYHNLQRLSPIILAKQPLLTEKEHDPGTFIPANTAEGQKLFSCWRNNAEIQETIRSLNDIASVITGDTTQRKQFSISFPTAFLEPVEQDKECFVLNHNGHSREVRIQDYDSIFSVPDLYEEVIQRALECNSPSIVASLLGSYFEKLKRDPRAAGVLEIGAGNGIVAEALKDYGFRRFYGIDRSLVAAAAAQRDRPGLYHSYAVANLGNKSQDGDTLESLSNFNPSLLLAVSCLGFSDAGVNAFLSGLTYIKGGAFMVTLRDRFYEEEGSDFRRMFDLLKAEGFIEIENPVRFVHRKSIDGRSIYYYALMGRMNRALNEDDFLRITHVVSTPSKGLKPSPN